MDGFSFFAVHGFGKVNPGGDWGSLDAWDWGAGFAEKSKHPAILDYIAVWTEFLGGFALLAGLLTRWAALGLTTVMLYAAQAGSLLRVPVCAGANVASDACG